jgi:Uma2 family endonuclease
MVYVRPAGAGRVACERLRFPHGAEQTMGMPAVQRHWTRADVHELMDEARPWPRYELIGGELVVTPSPGNFHQLCVSQLLRTVADYVDAERLGQTFTSPADLELQPGTVTQPDVFVVPAAAGDPEVETDGWDFVKALLLALEVVSPGSVQTDRFLKRDFYLGAGVPEYWIIDPDSRVVERWTAAQERPELIRDVFFWHPPGAVRPMRFDVAEFFHDLFNRAQSVGLRRGR